LFCFVFFLLFGNDTRQPFIIGSSFSLVMIHASPLHHRPPGPPGPPGKLLPNIAAEPLHGSDKRTCRGPRPSREVGLAGCIHSRVSDSLHVGPYRLSSNQLGVF
jgi:hypothetical protein